MKFREHRGTLKDSLETMIELPDRAALLRYIGLVTGRSGIAFEELAITDQGFDGRIGWHSHLISLPGYGVVGYTNEAP